MGKIIGQDFLSIGIGFGPSNIALAIALKNVSDDGKASAKHIFFDKQDEFSWHPGLLFPESTMQISFLKDLVSMVDPKSEFTFLNFLHAKGRLHHFINLRTFYPRRTEFEEYLRWAAKKLEDYAQFQKSVVSVELETPETPEISSLIVEVIDKNGGQQFHRTKNLILADGGFPVWPKGVSPSTRIVHGNSTLDRLAVLAFPDIPQTRFHIVGSGQSAADILYYLMNNFKQAKVIITHKSFAMRPEDDSHFINELFFPSGIELFEQLSQHWRDKVIRDYWHVTHNGVTIDMLPKLYEAVYYDLVSGAGRFSFNRFSELVGAREMDKGVVAEVKNLTTGKITDVRSDLLILATGYQRPCPHPLLQNLQQYFQTTEDGQSYHLDRNYQIVTTRQKLGFNVFMQGYGERTHGFSEALLSLVPIRAERIAKAIYE